MQTADNVAKWFLSRNRIQVEDAGADDISNLKLQKLLYYAQGLFLAFYDRPLFDDPIEAWEHGPVVKSIYQQYKGNHSAGIAEFEPPVENFTPEEEKILAFTAEQFGQFSAWKLRNMTHQETPWQTTKRNNIISQAKIKDYFKAHYVQED